MMRKLPILLLLGFLSGLMAQEKVREEPDSGSDYVLGPGDLIEIEVLNVEGYKHTVRLDTEGEVLLPFLGKLPAQGRTTTQLAEELTEKMNDVIFRNPSVSVTIREHHSQPILILGAVQSPGTYQKLRSNYTLVDLLSAAGGVASEAGDKIIIQRDREGVHPQSIELSMSDVYGARLNSLNFQLQPGDVVSIPPRETYNPNVYYVIGEVLRPGDFAFPKDREILLTQAVASAGGALKTAKASQGLLLRFNDDGTQSRIPIDYKKMLRGKLADLKIQPQDIIFIPGSTMKTIGYGMIGVIPATVQQATTTSVRP